MTAPAAQTGLDSRVTDETGAPSIAARLYRGWFRIRRAAGPDGVILEARIPGCLADNTRHDDQESAARAASKTYAEYRDAVRALSARPGNQED